MRPLIASFFGFAGAAAFAACGARTGLLADKTSSDAGVISDAEAVDAAPEGSSDAEADSLPLLDAKFADVVVPNDCPDAGSTFIYVLTDQNELLSFYPPTLGFAAIGNIACPTTATPFSMAENRTGIAYSVFTDGNLFRIDTATAGCSPTDFVPLQDNFSTFGMGFVADTADGGETLFVSEATAQANRPDSQGLASINTSSFSLQFVGAFNPGIPGPELTGTGDGRLFAFYTNATGSGSHIVEVDKSNGRILADNPLQVGSPNDAYAFAFWGGVFWVFTGTTQTQVTRFDPSDLSETDVTTLSDVVVGAGVSTCAPD